MTKKRIRIIFICNSDGILMKGKVCTKCKVAKPFSEFTPSKTHQTGFVSRCKSCNAEIKRIKDAELRVLQPQKEPIIKVVIVNGEQKTIRRCARCTEFKDIAQFHSNKSKKNGTASVCKSCCNKTTRINTRVTTLLINDKEVLAKNCWICNQVMPLVEFNNCKKSAGGKQSRCRECHKKYYYENKDHILNQNKEYRTLNAAKIKARKHKYYTLNKKSILSKNMKYRQLNYKSWINYIRNYYQINKEAIRKKRKSYYLINRAEILSKSKQHYENNKSAYTKYKAEYFQKNKERLTQKARIYAKNNHHKLLLSKRKWRKENQLIVKKNHQLRRAREKYLVNNITSQELEVIWETFNNTCALTEKKDNVSLDHFIPLNWLHGGTIVGNSYPLDFSLNSSMGIKNPFEWIKQPKIRSQVDLKKWNNLIEYLSKCNGLTPIEFESFVYWCENNKRTIQQAKNDNYKSSLELWLESKNDNQ